MSSSSSISSVGRSFFDTCETGQGWAKCSAFCTPDATFSAQCEPFLAMKKLEEYSDWMKQANQYMSAVSYEIVTFGLDEATNSITAYAIFRGTHTGEGGPCPPTGKSAVTDYVYVMKFNKENKICHLTKIWNSGLAMKDLGWA